MPSYKHLFSNPGSSITVMCYVMRCAMTSLCLNNGGKARVSASKSEEIINDFVKGPEGIFTRWINRSS